MPATILRRLNLATDNPGTFASTWIHSAEQEKLTSISPIDEKDIANVFSTDDAAYEIVLNESLQTFYKWREYPAPKRGELVRALADEFRKHKNDLAQLITLEMGKILPEAVGEVQEVIDIADFAVGLSRQLYGKTMHSERPQHRMYEQWHPLGSIGVITAFNFPVAVWSWNAMIAAVCGNTIIWKPSELTPLTAIATQKICESVTKSFGFPGLFSLVSGGRALGEKLAADKRLPLISATGSSKMGRDVGETVAKRFGRSLLELGGNNAIIVLADADLELALRAVLFGAVGTSGQRCTSTRRILIDKKIEPQFTKRLLDAYAQIRIGSPLEASTLLGPLVSAEAVNSYLQAIEQIRQQGGEILCGAKVLQDMPSKLYVEPTIVRAKHSMPIIQEETFAPILYVIPVTDFDEAMAYHNDVPQGLSSAIFTTSIRSAERFLSVMGSDCGIANVNIGTSGAEIGGAFGGEKETGGGREAGSDAWKIYMRRQTNTINWGSELPLAQGLVFG